MGWFLGIDSGEESVPPYLEDPQEIEQFVVTHPDQLRLNLCKAASADIPSCELQFDSQRRLRPSSFITQLSNLRPDHIQKFHGPRFGS